MIIYFNNLIVVVVQLLYGSLLLSVSIKLLQILLLFKQIKKNSLLFAIVCNFGEKKLKRTHFEIEILKICVFGASDSMDILKNR